MKPLLSTCAPLLLTSLAWSQVVQWNIERIPIEHGLYRRSDDAVETTIQNERARGGYYATVGVGNPRQELTLQIDTGSSDVWVPYLDAGICTSTEGRGCTLGSFDPATSSSYARVGPNLFDITYTDDSYARGDYFKDDFRIGGVEIQNLTMGLGVRTTISHGLIGVGYALSEASTTTADATYPNLPIAMEQEGLINSVAYSLWLNDLDASTGNILFGGVDTGKYIGTLTSIEVVPDERVDNFTHFTVALTTLEATSPSGSDILTSQHFPIHAVLDSGTTLSYLPNDIVSQVWEEVGAHDNPGYFSFGFAGPNGPHINVTMDELVVDLTGGNPPQFASGPHDGELVCGFGIQNFSSGPFILGDTFLRSAYVVYDLENNQIAMAPTNFNSTETDIVAFASKGAAIPSATVAPDQDTTTTPHKPTGSDLTAADGFQGRDSGTSATKYVSTLSLTITYCLMGLMMMEFSNFFCI
ncbi:putative aspartic-type endopeptidase [Paramyrothecium foliicola]|nr:putative aspartic-type endopeptidase [Paramyrothecium foliicola]